MAASPEIARQNGKKGGRPKGKKNPATLEKEAVIAAFRQRAMKIASNIFDKQLVLINGQQFLYKIEKEWIATGKKGFWRNKKPELVESESEIRDYLENLAYKSNGDLEDENDPGATYYFITTKEPNNQAIDSMLDRTFGKSTQSVEHSGPDGGAIEITGVDITIRE